MQLCAVIGRRRWAPTWVRNTSHNRRVRKEEDGETQNVCPHLGRFCSTSSGSPRLLWASGLLRILVLALLSARSASRLEPESTSSRHRRNLQLSGYTARERETVNSSSINQSIIRSQTNNTSHISCWQEAFSTRESLMVRLNVFFASFFRVSTNWRYSGFWGSR